MDLSTKSIIDDDDISSKIISYLSDYLCEQDQNNIINICMTCLRNKQPWKKCVFCNICSQIHNENTDHEAFLLTSSAIPGALIRMIDILWNNDQNLKIKDYACQTIDNAYSELKTFIINELDKSQNDLKSKIMSKNYKHLVEDLRYKINSRLEKIYEMNDDIEEIMQTYCINTEELSDELQMIKNIAAEQKLYIDDIISNVKINTDRYKHKFKTLFDNFGINKELQISINGIHPSDWYSYDMLSNNFGRYPKEQDLKDILLLAETESDELTNDNIEKAIIRLNHIEGNFIHDLSLKYEILDIKFITNLLKEIIYEQKHLSLNTLELNISPSIITDDLIKTLMERILNFKNINTFSLSLGGLTDYGMNQIIAILENFENLKNLTFNLTYTKITDQSMNYFASKLQNTKNLKNISIYLGNTKITDDSIKNLMFSLSNLSTLVGITLNLSNTKITDDSVKQISLSLDDLPNLMNLSLNIFNTKTTDESIKQLFITLESLKNLKYLELNAWSAKLTDDSVIQISSALINLMNLHHLDLNLGSTKITDESFNNLVLALNHLKRLNHLGLDFNNTKLGDDSIKQISVILGNLKYLNSIFLDFNCTYITDESIKQIASALINQKNLNKFIFNIWNNYERITDNSIKDLALALANMKNLTSLQIDLSCTDITNESIKQMATSMSNFKNLIDFNINLGRTKVTDESIKQIGILLTDYKNLVNFGIFLSNTKITDNSIRQILWGLHALKHLKSLKLDLINTQITDASIEIFQDLISIKQLLGLYFCCDDCVKVTTRTRDIIAKLNK